MAIKSEDLLRELELLPVWRQREIQAMSPVPTAAMYEPAPKIPAASETMQEQEAEYAAEATAEPMTTGGEPQTLAEEIAPADSLPPVEGRDEPSALLSPGGPDRARLIMRMDWAELEQAVEHCPACNLCETRTKTVFGVGDRNADWLFVGEAPGAEEDRKGEPFVGQAGKLLDNMLAAIRLKRGDNVYIANVLKCCPPCCAADKPGDRSQRPAPHCIRAACRAWPQSRCPN